jgi:hypothetical protein
MRQILLVLCTTLLLAQVGVAQNDWDVFRLLYDRVADIVTPGLSADGHPLEIFLVEMPGLAIRREDFDRAAWRAGGFSTRSPSAAEATLVDRVPTYTSIVFADSGRKISQLWGYLLSQFVVPVELDKAQQALLQDADLHLANGTLEAEVSRRETLYENALENSLANRAQCLADREPSVCAQKAIVWREELRRSWFALETKRGELETAESRVIGLQNRDMNNAFARALEVYTEQKRVDIGAQEFGTEYWSTSLQPSNWWTWWPLDATLYDGVADPRINGGVVTFADGAGVSALDSEPAHGTVTFGSAELTYEADDGYIGADEISWATTDSELVTKRVAVNGPVLEQDDAAWVSVSMDQNSIVDTADSEYASFHFSTTLRAQNALKFTGNFNSSLVRSDERVQFASSQFNVSFEIAKVSIQRPWIDLTLLDLTPVGLRGVRPGGWSDGSAFFAQVSSYAFKLLPTSFVVARNIRLSSAAIDQYSEAIEETFDIGADASLQIGPFFTGTRQSTVDGSSSRTFTSSRFNSGVLEIDGPQIIGWSCAPLAQFPTADWEEIAAANVDTLEALFNFEQIQAAAAAASASIETVEDVAT